MIKIGDKVFNSNVFLAPLAGCSDLPFRLICREHGAQMAFFEMISCNALVREREKTLSMLKSVPADKPIAGQLLGSDSHLMLDAALKMRARANVEFIDINAACPVKKVVGNCQGAALFRTPETLFAIIKILALKAGLPVSVKLRTGFDRSDTEALINIVKGCEDAGASAIFLHGRTRAQMYGGDVDYEAVRKAKESLNIPLFASGNILSAPLAKKMFDETGCDGIIVARGAMGNPWIFKDIGDFLKKGIISPRPEKKQRIEALKRHLAYIRKYSDLPPLTATGLMRKAALWYLKDFASAASARGKVTEAQTYEEILKVLDK